MLRLAFIELDDALVHEVEARAPDGMSWNMIIRDALRFALDEADEQAEAAEVDEVTPPSAA